MLPDSGNVVGDVWNTADTGENFAWDGEQWDSLRGDIEYATTLQLGDEIARAKREESTKVPLLSHTSGTPDNNFNGYGYRGTLRNLGLYGESVVIGSLSIITRPSGNQNAGTDLWARILKAVDGQWIVASQSKAPRTWDDVPAGTELEFEMEAVEGVSPPSADEEIAIVWVNNPAAAANISNGPLSFRSIGTIAGAMGFPVTSAPTISSNISSFSPVLKLRFVPLAGRNGAAERLAVLEAKIATLEAALNVATLSFPTGMSDHEVPSVTQHGTLVTAGTLPASSAAYVIHVLGVNRETLNATCEVDWVSNVQTQASVFWDENTNKGCILFDVAQNYDATPRSTTITLTSSALNEVYTIQITQAGA